MHRHGSINNTDCSSLYWGRKAASFRGIVVLFSWFSVHEQQLRSFLDLYSSLGWNSLVSNSNFLDAFYPERATSLAFVLINELVEELRIKPCPVVFVALSGGLKACMHKVFQIIQGTCEGQLNMDENRLVRNCIAGQIYDSSPVDFTSDFYARFGLHSTIQKVPGSSKLVSWVAKGVASALDGLCLTRFESQRARYWQALYNSVNFGTPFLIICSDNDAYAPQQIIFNFARCLLALGGDVELVKLNGSPHIGHYECYPIQYRAAVTSLLEKAASVYSRRICQLGERSVSDGMHDEISELICDLQNVAVNSNQSLRRVAVRPSDHFFLPSSSEHHSQESRSLQDERNARSAYLPTPSISAHGVLGKFLFDVCVPKNVEGWDVRFSGSVNGQPYATACRHAPFTKIRYSRRSKL